MPIDFYYLEYSGPTVSVGFIAGKSDRRSFELENELSLLWNTWNPNLWR